MKRTRLTRLEVENFKRITALSIDPNGNVIELSGPNGAGKSSVLDAMWTLLKGVAVAPVEPIRKGAERCRISARLGELIVTRTFRHKEGGGYTSDIKLTNPEGASFPAPQKKLDAFIGDHMLDPHEFLQMTVKDQFDALRRFVPDVDFDAIDAANNGDYERRTDVNRQARETKVRANAIVVPVETPQKPVDEAALVAELESAGKHNAEIEQRKANRAGVAREIDSLVADVTRNESAIAALEAKVGEHRQAIESIRMQATTLQTKLADAPPLPEPIDTTEISARINRARSINADVRRLDERTKLHQAAADLEKQSADYTARMDAREKDKQAKIAAATLPVAGIGFGPGNTLLLNDLPFEQASQGERLRTAFALAVAQHPQLPLVWIRDASLLDDASMKLVADLAAEHDCQVWLETVRATGENAVLLEDGHLKAAEAQGAEAAA